MQTPPEDMSRKQNSAIAALEGVDKDSIGLSNAKFQKLNSPDSYHSAIINAENSHISTQMIYQRSKKYAHVKSRLGIMPMSRGSGPGSGSHRSGSDNKSPG